MDPHDFQNEDENFLWALYISKEEYIEEIIPGTGRGKPLRKEHRQIVWDAKCRVEEQLGPGYTRASGAVRLKRHLKSESSGETHGYCIQTSETRSQFTDSRKTLKENCPSAEARILKDLQDSL